MTCDASVKSVKSVVIHKTNDEWLLIVWFIEIVFYLLKDVVDVIQYFLVGKTHDVIPHCFQIILPNGIVLCLLAFCMVTTIDFYNQSAMA